MDQVLVPFLDEWLISVLLSFVRDFLTSTNIEETFLHDFLEIQNF